MQLVEFFAQNPVAAIAFSGGTDSAYLLAAAVKAGCRVQPYFADSPFQPRFELEHAQRLCGELGVELRVIAADPLADETIAQNGPRRCYYCKRAIFSALLAAASADGYTQMWDGTNASDDAADRPGMKALEEMQIKSPLRLCGLTKAQVRQNSKELGLFTWNKPAYACLATRVPNGTAITIEALQRVETAENALFAMGYTDFRVRVMGTIARLQLPASQFERVAKEYKQITAALAPVFSGVLLDLAPRGEE